MDSPAEGHHSQEVPGTWARERVLDAAERLFMERGFVAVTLRDIAAAVGIRHTSLYHHAPGGKEALFVEVVERSFARHRAGLEGAIAQAAPDIRAQLRAIAGWLLSQPPMDLVRMAFSDLSAIDPAHTKRLTAGGYAALLLPIERTLQRERERGEIEHHNLGLIAGGILGMLQSLRTAPTPVGGSGHREMAYELLDVMLDGLRPRSGGGTTPM